MAKKLFFERCTFLMWQRYKSCGEIQNWVKRTPFCNSGNRRRALPFGKALVGRFRGQSNRDAVVQCTHQIIIQFLAVAALFNSVV